MSKKLVAYFSASGITAKVAEDLADAIGADIFEIRPEVPYTKADLNWMDKKSRSTIEMSNPDFRPAIAAKRDNMDSYGMKCPPDREDLRILSTRRAFFFAHLAVSMRLCTILFQCSPNHILTVKLNFHRLIVIQIFQGRLIDNDSCTFCLNTLHNALNRTLTEIVGV